MDQRARVRSVLFNIGAISLRSWQHMARPLLQCLNLPFACFSVLKSLILGSSAGYPNTVGQQAEISLGKIFLGFVWK